MFGNLFHQKNRILARLKGVQIGLSNQPNVFLVRIDKELRTKLAEVSALEEEYWAMKSCITWLVEGDKNTAFYHTSALVCRNRNRISCLKDHLGNWMSEAGEIADFIRNGYLELFMSSHSSSILLPWDPPPCWNSCLKEDEIVKLSNSISDEEISSTFYSLKAFKASGTDGLHAGFFQRFWLLVRDSVKKEVNQICSSLIMPEYLNRTLITLIPKCNNPESLGNYRPISLCNTVYKVVTKMILAESGPCSLTLSPPTKQPLCLAVRE